jgi:putative FmdB family regulatory protein
MPTYTYECEKCGEFEVFQRMSEPELKKHEQCGCNAQRVLSKVPFILRGKCWASDCYSISGDGATKNENA